MKKSTTVSSRISVEHFTRPSTDAMPKDPVVTLKKIGGGSFEIRVDAQNLPPALVSLIPTPTIRATMQQWVPFVTEAVIRAQRLKAAKLMVER